MTEDLTAWGRLQPQRGRTNVAGRQRKNQVLLLNGYDHGYMVEMGK